MADRTITFDLVARDKMSDAFNGAGNSASGFGGKLKGLASGALAGFAAAFAVDKIVDFGAKLLEAGQQADVFAKKAQTVFGDSAASVAAWATETAGSLGMTDKQLLGVAASFGDLLVPMGFTREEAAKMSTQTVELSGALSAWSGGQQTAAEVADVLSKAMLGERDGLKALGISISDADVKQRLMEKGQKDLTGAALAQATAMATQELITEKSTDAQAAWTDGSMDATKKQNELKAKLAEVTETLGEKLLPIATAFTTWLVDEAIPFVERLIETHGPWITAVMETAVAIGQDLVEGFFALLDAALPIIATVLDAFLAAVEAIVGGAAAAFGWVPGVGEKLRSAARAIEGFRDDANRALAGIMDRNVKVTVQTVHTSFGSGGPVRRFHSGGMITADLPTMPGLRFNERPAILEVGERVLPKNAAGGVTQNIAIYEADGVSTDLLVRRLAFQLEGALG